MCKGLCSCWNSRTNLQVLVVEGTIAGAYSLQRLWHCSSNGLHSVGLLLTPNLHPSTALE